MARFPYRRSNVAALGKLLARARLDNEFRKQFIANPKAELERIGLPENALHLMDFKVVDPADPKTVALPYRLNQAKIDNKDPAYLGALAQQFGAIN